MTDSPRAIRARDPAGADDDEVEAVPHRVEVLPRGELLLEDPEDALGREDQQHLLRAVQNHAAGLYICIGSF